MRSSSGVALCENDDVNTLSLAHSQTRSLRDFSLSPRFGWKKYTIRRAFLLSVCILGVVQYGMVLVWGSIEEDVVSYYQLTSTQGTDLYDNMNLGACALSFIPGLCYDCFGPAVAMAIGTIIGILPVGLQIVWSPTFPEGLSAFNGLCACYVFFGLSASFYNVIGCLAPVVAFETKHVGKASGLVQVCLSLGLTLQSAAYAVIKANSSDFIEAYLVYVLVSTFVCGTLMSMVLWFCRPLFFHAPVPKPQRQRPTEEDQFPKIMEGTRLICAPPADSEYLTVAIHKTGVSDVVLGAIPAGSDVVAAGPPEEVLGVMMVPIQYGRMAGAVDLQYFQVLPGLSGGARVQELRAICALFCSVEFLYMSFFFIGAVGFSFSFLEVEGKIANEVGVDASELLIVFGVLNALGRILVSVPLDYTKGHPYGGVHTYIVLSLVIFFAGLLCLILPSPAGSLAVRVANSVIGLGYGGMLGSVPLALRDFFGSTHLGLIYGLLYFWVYGSIYFWGLISGKPDGCNGVTCYRPYCLGGSASVGLVIALGIVILLRNARRNSGRTPYLT